MEIYTHHVNSAQMAAQGKFLEAIGFSKSGKNEHRVESRVGQAVVKTDKVSHISDVGA
jgi:hypothetical protein